MKRRRALLTRMRSKSIPSPFFPERTLNRARRAMPRATVDRNQLKNGVLSNTYRHPITCTGIFFKFAVTANSSWGPIAHRRAGSSRPRATKTRSPLRRGQRYGSLNCGRFEPGETQASSRRYFVTQYRAHGSKLHDAHELRNLIFTNGHEGTARCPLRVKMGRTRVEHMSSALPPESRHNGDATALPVGRNGYAAPIRSRAVLMSTSHGGKGHCSLRHRHRRARPDMATLVYQIFLGFRACHRDTNRSTIY